MENQILLKTHQESLRTLRDILPSFEGVSSLEPAEAARSVLSWVISAALESGDSPEPLPENPETCPNCNLAFASKRSPYCCERCKDEAAFVRQVRAGLLDPGFLEMLERQVALGQKLWRMLGGGLPLRVGLIPERTIQKLLTRNCEVCGLPAKHIDNMGSG